MMVGFGNAAILSALLMGSFSPGSATAVCPDTGGCAGLLTDNCPGSGESAGGCTDVSYSDALGLPIYGNMAEYEGVRACPNGVVSGWKRTRTFICDLWGDNCGACVSDVSEWVDNIVQYKNYSCASYSSCP